MPIQRWGRLVPITPYVVVLTVKDNFGRRPTISSSHRQRDDAVGVRPSASRAPPAVRGRRGSSFSAYSRTFRRMSLPPTAVLGARLTRLRARAGRRRAGRAGRHPARQPALPGEPRRHRRRAGGHRGRRGAAGGLPLPGGRARAPGIAAGLPRPAAPPGAGQLRRRAGRVSARARRRGDRLRGAARQRGHARRLARAGSASRPTGCVPPSGWSRTCGR